MLHETTIEEYRKTNFFQFNVNCYPFKCSFQISHSILIKTNFEKELLGVNS